MRYLLLLLLVALAVVLVLHYGRGGNPSPAQESAVSLDRAKLAALSMQLQQVEAALDAWAGERGEYPADLAELVPGFLRAADLLIDPWGTRLRLERSGERGAVLVSAGPDHAFASRDDIRRSL